jgi:hypothetical protein
MQEFPNLSQEAWDAALEQHRNRYRIPERVTNEQALDHFSTIGRMALKSLMSSYANRVRAKQRLTPIRLVISHDMATWIESQIQSLDSVSGHLGSKSYQTIANAMLPKLRALEHTFLAHGEE